MTFKRVDSLTPQPQRRGAEALLEILASEGVDYIFGNPGTTELPLIDALLREPNIHYVFGLQESSVVAMADGYAQASGKVGFVNLHTSGGLGHGMGCLLSARVSQTPLVVTAGQQDQRHMVTDPLLFDDLVGIATPATKWAKEVTSARQLPIMVRRAFHDAEAAPQGPVFLSLPMDVMEGMTDVDIGHKSRIYRRTTAEGLPELAEDLVAVAPGKLALIAGDEIRTSQAAADVVRVAELLGTPVFGSSWPFCMPFPTDHPLWQGNLPGTAAQIAQVLSDYDTVLALGGNSLVTILYSEGTAMPSNCKVYQLSDSVTNLGRIYSTYLSMVGDIKTSLTTLIPLIEQQLTAAQRTGNTARIATFRRHRADQRILLTQQVVEQWSLPVISPLVAAHEVMKAIGPSVPIIDEAVATSRYIKALMNRNAAAQYAFIRGGALGWGMPAAVGTSLGIGREPVVSLVGDGAALYSPQCLWTAAREQLPVTFIVMNNREYNVLKNFMRQQKGYVSAQSNEFIAMDIEPAIDYQALATAMGVPARRIDKASDIAEAVATAIRSGKPNLIEIAIRPE
ncbi:thiamine pyrophosphate-binding protein [Zymobacter sp. IVIA_12111.31 C1]|uniref:thiamine pyrophosphate-binding protein n=1 Tax=Zymobacter sp. IVIA_12111.31 C1 TaxID=3394854 RepID=UPI0039C1210B